MPPPRVIHLGGVWTLSLIPLGLMMHFFCSIPALWGSFLGLFATISLKVALLLFNEDNPKCCSRAFAFLVVCCGSPVWISGAASCVIDEVLVTLAIGSLLSLVLSVYFYFFNE